MATLASDPVAYTKANFRDIQQIKKLATSHIDEIDMVANVLPFRVNNYVVNQLINWSDTENDPVFKMTFPCRDMLKPDAYEMLESVLNNPASTEQAKAVCIFNIRQGLNPNPAGQKTLNVPRVNDEPINGIQHKYHETVLFFPSQAQVCHAYCSFCFRWPQFVGIEDLKFSTKDLPSLFAYLQAQKAVTDVLFTGGDPMVVSTRLMQSYLEPLLGPGFEHVNNIRIGTKSLSYWPYRFTHDKDADALLRLFEKCVRRGKHLAFMANISHSNELQSDVCQLAIKRILNTGVTIRSQGPVLKHVNASGNVWSNLWRQQVKLGIIPYYMFVERNTGANNYFEIPLDDCLQVYNSAQKNISGLCKTARGPVMSTTPGKIEILGIQEINQQKVFLLRFIQARNNSWLNKPFFAAYDGRATWFDELKPAFNAEKFFFQES